MAPTLPRRRLSKWTGRWTPVPLGEWVQQHLATRRHRIAWNFFKEAYEPRRHRKRFARFLTSLTEGRSAASRVLADVFGRLLAGQVPMSQPGAFTRYHRTGSNPAHWLRAFFADEPEWEHRLRNWIRDPARRALMSP